MPPDCWLGLITHYTVSLAAGYLFTAQSVLNMPRRKMATSGFFVTTIAQLIVVFLGRADGQFRTQTYGQAPPAQVNYFQGFLSTQLMIMQVQQTTTVTYIVSPMTSAFSQFVINNPRGLVLASQRANQRMQDLALQAFSFRRMGLDNKRSDSTLGMHTIFIGTKPASMALMDDKTLIDFLLTAIFDAMGLSPEKRLQAMRELIVYNKQGAPNPSVPVFATVTPAPSTLESPTSPFNPLTCQDSVRLDCDPTVPFRTADGTCNNLRHDLWGSSFTPLRRFLPPDYNDGISAPRTQSVLGGPLPSARLISTSIHPNGPEGEVKTLTHMVMQWGQFMDHDLTNTPLQTASDGSALTCCEDEMPASSRGFVDVNNRTACFPIPIPPDDPFFIGRTCFSFPRSVQVTNADCQQTPVEQLNQVTSYIDASQVYGSSTSEQRELRTFVGGELKTSGDDLLPRDDEETCVLNNPSRDYCFKAGDTRVNEQMALSSMHTVWLRHHNRMTAQLSQINPHWNDEQLFQVARKILGAQMQKITYGEWLPIVLDQRRLTRYGLQLQQAGQANFYNINVDASIRNAFATAGFRFGHSLIRSTLSQMTHNYQIAGQWRLEQSFGNTSQILASQGLGVAMYMRGLLRDRPNRVDRFFTGEIQNHLFQDRTGNSLDLVAFNIQRGRDHGLPPYNAWRRYCGLPPIVSFNNMPDHDPITAQRFSQIYRSPDDIDLFSGGISERPEGGGLVGPTFACILSEQFSDVKFGDRFWFETGDPVTGFTPNQLEQIRGYTLSRLLCDATSITQIQPNPFIQIGLGNPLTNCQDLPEMNMMLWQEGGQGFPETPTWGAWETWSQCQNGGQTRVRSCSQGGNRGVCSGPGQDSRVCNDAGWTASWTQWSGWFDCELGSQKRTRVCVGFDNPCPGSPEEVRICRGPSVSNRQVPRSLFTSPEPLGWAPWQPWDVSCTQGRRWRKRTCNSGGRGPRLGACSGPSRQSQLCDFGGPPNQGRRGSSSFNFNVCAYFNMPALC